METDALIYFAMWHARCEILRHVTCETCIFSTRLVCAIYRQLGIKSFPLTVEAQISNKALRDKADRGEDFDATDPNEPAFGSRIKYDPSGEAMGAGWWGGHLALIANGDTLVDPSMDQFSHPERGVVLQPTSFRFPSNDALESWLYDDEKMVSIFLPGDGDLRIDYVAHPDNLTYRDCEDWGTAIEGDPLFDRVLENVIGLADLYAESEGLPPLPALPPSLSAKGGVTAEVVALANRSAKLLGLDRPGAYSIPATATGAHEIVGDLFS